MKSSLSVHRRRFLKTGCASLALGCISRRTPLVAAPAAHDLAIRKIDRVTVKIPFRPIPERNMARELPHWKYIEICTVHLQSGHTGHGETLLFYTWKPTTDAAVERAVGKNAAELMWDDELGAGLQMAIFDAVARACDVPIHRLLGRQVQDKTALSWWNIDTSPEDMAAECREAYRQGYRAYKTKGRPWFDVYEQMRVVTDQVPGELKIAIDFNGTLLNAQQAIPLVSELANYPQTDIYETPIPQRDIAGNQELRKATRVKIAMHYGSPSPEIAIQEAVCDGFVVGGGATTLLHRSHIAEMAGLPFWLQLVGTGITAAYSLHFGAVTRNSTWAAVNCHQLYKYPLITRPIEVHEGFAAIPQSPGLGYEIDWNAVERFRVEKPARRPNPKRLIEVTWRDGRQMIFNHLAGHNMVLSQVSQLNDFPYFERGVTTRLLLDDGSERWRALYERSREQPLRIAG